MIIGIFGSNGMLGRYMSAYLSQLKYLTIINFTRKDLDVSDFNQYDKIKELISKCEVVLNCAGTIKPIADKQSADKTFMVNSIFPQYLDRVCNELNIRLVHYTTDCVFSGTQSYDATEYQKHDIYDVYGFSKSLGEIKHGINIRTSIIGEEINNNRSLLEWAKSKKDTTVNGYTNHFWNGMTCLQLAKCTKMILDEPLELYDHHLHLYSNTVNKYELLKLISDAFKLNLTINAVEPNCCNRELKSVFVVKYRKYFENIPNLKFQLEELSNFSHILAAHKID